MIRAIRRWFDRTECGWSRERRPAGRSRSRLATALLELERAGITEERARAGARNRSERSSALGSNVMQLERLRRAKGWR